MGLNDYLVDFCKKHGYTYSLVYDKKTKEYSIALANGKECGVFTMTKEELKGLNNQQIKNMLNFLHEGIQLKTKARE